MADFITAFRDYFLRFENDLIEEAAIKGQKIPVSSFRWEADENGGQFFAAHYMKYIIAGRGPGKFPPVDKMREWVEGNPEVLDSARQIWRDITVNQLAFIIGRKIAREGTDVWSGKKPGIDLPAVVGKHLTELQEALGKAEVFNIATSLKSAIK